MSAVLKKLAPKEDKEHKKHYTGPMHHRPMVLGNKGLLHVHHQVLDDLFKLIPHAKKEGAVPPDEIHFLDTIASDRHCDTVVLFETRHRKNPECYMWISSIPNGPSVSFYIKDAISVSQLRALGNCLKGSRPLIFFDPALDDNGIFSMSKILLRRMFSVPYQDPHSKPFVDQTLTFYKVDDTIMIRHYQIQWNDDEPPMLMEIGPRVQLLPVLVLAGAFKGSKIWENPLFVSPYKKMKADRIKKAKRRMKERDIQAKREERRQNIPKQEDPMKGLFD
ncbi:Ribosome biogenesis protein BRX1 [Histomonas meleagridis]|uniref:Ribosome biogenesis protein BRX1 n=1 Tax=Histomonas meleagridis TaxID=135588 RepID=UPI00355ABC0D|nr:Ribosome biogenesis protein BRX1 [Histomonas meleagridis]KAH0804206.1 Ribosome biogenesis protein BRX1 [Histomonas meleagridis]